MPDRRSVEHTRPGLASSHVGNGRRRDREVRIPLHELADQRSAIETEAFIRHGELTPDLEQQWDAIGGSARRRIYSFGLLICDLEDYIAAVDHAIARLTERRRTFVKEIERKKDYVQPQMARLGIRSVEGPLCKVALHKNSTLSVERLTDPHEGPQTSLFASRPAEAHSTRTGTRKVRGQHVRTY